VLVYFDIAEIQAIAEITIYMKDWMNELDDFIIGPMQVLFFVLYANN